MKLTDTLKQLVSTASDKAAATAKVIDEASIKQLRTNAANAVNTGRHKLADIIDPAGRQPSK